MATSAEDYLKSEIDRLITRAGQITSEASKDGGSLDREQKAEVQRLLSDAESMRERVKEMKENDQLNQQIEAMRRAQAPRTEQAKGPEKAEPKTWGAAFVKSDAYRSLQGAFKAGALTGNWSSGPVEMPHFFDGKAVPTGTLTTDAYPFSEAAADVRPGIQSILQRPITITDLLAQGTTDSSVIRYVQETLFTNGAATVAEGELKPQSALAFDNVDEPVRKIATFLPVSDEMLEDGAQMRSYLDGRLRLAVQLTEETQLLSGDGTGSNIRGLLNRTGLQTLAIPAPGATANRTIAEYLYTAITNVRVNALVEPDGIVLHPTNYAALRLAKDNGGEFNAGGPFGGLAGNQVWGLPVALSHAIPVNTALVGAFRTQAQVFRRNGLTVEASNSHADFFQRNLTAIRAEVRVGLACYRPSAFAVVTGLQNAGLAAAA
jgi:HK97 family phage major capsid protein